MKTLVEFIRENTSYTIFTIDGVNAEVQDIIDEALTLSHNTDKLIEKLSSHYNIKKSNFKKTTVDSKIRSFYIDIKYIEQYLDDKWLNDTLLMFGYYITKVNKAGVIFEPIFTNNITDIIQDDCDGKIYKIVNNQLAKKIVSRGGLYTDKDDEFYKYLKQTRTSDKEQRSNASKSISDMLKKSNRLNDFGYRMFTSRLFFFSGETKKDLQKGKQEVLRQLKYKEDEYQILEIDISKYNVNCYVDTYTRDDMRNKKFYLFYINAFFPLENITFYSNEQFNELFK